MGGKKNPYPVFIDLEKLRGENKGVDIAAAG